MIDDSFAIIDQIRHPNTISNRFDIMKKSLFECLNKSKLILFMLTLILSFSLRYFKGELD